MDKLLTITQMARLRGVTTETLRHYDRIGLVKAYKIDEQTRQRYYSILQYEEIGTIKELQQLGLSLKEIKEYLDNRTIKKTLSLLEENQKILKEKIRTLEAIEKSIAGKLDFLNQLKNLSVDSEIQIKEIPEDRYYLVSDIAVSSEVELSYQAMNLEAQISEKEPYLPIFASNRYAGIYQDYQMGVLSPFIGIQIDGPRKSSSNVETIPKGNYLSILYEGSFWENKKQIEKLFIYATENNIKVANQILQCQWLDYTFVRDKERLIYEIQVRIL